MKVKTFRRKKKQFTVFKNETGYFFKKKQIGHSLGQILKYGKITTPIRSLNIQEF